MGATCPWCACTATHPAHAVLAALGEDDLDAALQRGLLDAPPCPACAADCRGRLARARDARCMALAARERHRARAHRLDRRKREREAARRPPATALVAPPLPAAAADVLARALAKAAARKP